jgi:adenine-specific DNA-methyltransferase
MRQCGVLNFKYNICLNINLWVILIKRWSNIDMRYFGSKTSTLTTLKQIIEKYFLSGIACDPFGGIGTVGTFMKNNGFSVISGDILRFAYCFQVAKIAINNLQDFKGISLGICVEKYLDSLPGRDGWLVKHYAIDRKFFTTGNAKKIQACIDTIWKWHDDKAISDTEYCLLIASLINCMDRVANTAGTYYAYLKTFTSKALRPFCYELIKTIVTQAECYSYLSDAIELVKKINCDILYLDPPYNERDYCQYYHLPETIAAKILPSPHGVSGIHRHGYTKSAFSKKDTVCTAFTDLIKDSNYKLLIFHYSDTGILPMEFIYSVLSKQGKVFDTYCISKGYTTMGKNSSTKHHIYWVVRS